MSPTTARGKVERTRADDETAQDVVDTVTVVLEPPMGWETGFTLLLNGFCPYCGFRVSQLQADRAPPIGEGLTWCCLNGCNP